MTQDSIATGCPASFPFTAVSGMQASKEALLLLAVDDGLKGVLIAGGPGTGKSLLAGAFGALLTDPRQPGGPAFVEASPGITDDGLLGRLNLERTLLTGKRQFENGLLVRAHGGVLYAPGAHLLDAGAARLIAGALECGAFAIEREGFSGRLASHFVCLASYSPADGEVNHDLSDALGMHVWEDAEFSTAVRREILERVSAFGANPEAFSEGHCDDLSALREQIDRARERLPRVEITSKDERRLVATALSLGIEGHRADVFAARAARARAALYGRASVEEEDLEAAVKLVLAPRATRTPKEPPIESRRPEPNETEAREQESQPGPKPSVAEARASQSDPGRSEDLAIQAVNTDVGQGWLEPDSAGAGRKRPANAGRRTTADSLNFSRGRYIRASAGPAAGGKIALEATLRAAAPRQAGRRRARPGSDNQRIHLTPADLRFKQFRQKTGLLIIFGVDASGSMALNRLNQAKGAALKLLQNAYVHRDRVALVSFRGSGAEVLLRPTRSVEFAKRAVTALPAGGGTPLAAGIEAALELARSERGACGRTLLVLLTDGRANVARSGAQPDERDRNRIWRDVELACSALHGAGVAAVVIDTASRLTSNGDAERLAALLHGKYVSLPSGDAGAVCDEVRRCSVGMRA